MHGRSRMTVDPRKPYNAGTEDVGFPPTRQPLLAFHKCLSRVTRSHLRCVSGGNYLEIRVENLVEVKRGIYADYSHAPRAKEKSGTYLHRTVSMLLHFHFSSSRKQYRYCIEKYRTVCDLALSG